MCNPAISIIPASILQSPLSVKSGSPLRPFFMKVIENKVNQTAMNIFKRIFNYIVDYLCTKFYTAYRGHLFACAPSRKMYNDIPVFDHTARQYVTIKEIPGATANICIDGKIVCFYIEKGQPALSLNTNSGTRKIGVAADTDYHSKYVTIFEEREDATRTWKLDITSKPTVINNIEYFLVDTPEEYLTRV